VAQRQLNRGSKQLLGKHLSHLNESGTAGTSEECADGTDAAMTAISALSAILCPSRTVRKMSDLNCQVV
jgi:hypothetical protein